MEEWELPAEKVRSEKVYIYILDLGFLLMLIGASGLVVRRFGIIRTPLLKVSPFMIGVGGIIAAFGFGYHIEMREWGTGPSMVAVNPQGTRLYVYSQKDNAVSIFDTATKRKVGVVPVPHRFSTLFEELPADARLYVISHPDITGGNQTVTVIDTTHNKVLSTMEVVGWPQRGRFYAVDYPLSSLETTSLSSSDRHVIELTDTASGKSATIPNGTTKYSSESWGNAISPSRSLLYAAVGDLGSGLESLGGIGQRTLGIAVLDVAGGYRRVGIVRILVEQLESFEPDFSVLAADPTGRYLAAGIRWGPDRQGLVAIIDTATNAVMSKIPLSEYPENIAFDPSGARVYVANFYAGTVSVIDISGRKVAATVKVGERPLGLAVAPSGRYVYVANSGSETISVMDTATSRVVGTMWPWSLAMPPVTPSIGARALSSLVLLVLIGGVILRVPTPTMRVTRAVLITMTVLTVLSLILSFLYLMTHIGVTSSPVSQELDRNLWKTLIIGSASLSLQIVLPASIIGSWLLFIWRNYRLAVLSSLVPLIIMLTIVIFSL